MKYILHIGLVLFGIIVFNRKAADCITCLNCNDVHDLGSCDKAIVCEANETCHIEKVLSPVNFEPVYNTGCRHMDYCILEICNKQAYGDGHSRKRQGDNDLTLCSRCCFDDNCNAEGCGYKHNKNNFTKCFSCHEVYEGGPQCRETVDCDLKLYACSVTNNPGSFHSSAYTLGCTFKRRQCDLYVNLTNANKDKNVKCCDTTLCNVSPYNRKLNKTEIAHNLKCPEGIIKTTTPLQTSSTTEKTTTITTTTKATTTERPTTKPPLTPGTTLHSTCSSHVTKQVPLQYLNKHGNKCYEYVSTVGSWMHARIDCHSKGGHLLSITNAEEQIFISNLISKVYFITKLWLGLNDRVNEGKFSWDTGETVNYTNWAPGRYVDQYHDQEDCVVMTRNGKWDDVDCNGIVNGSLISYNWICQYTDSYWSSWQPWSTCSVTCGVGSRIRTRHCNNPTPQNGGSHCIGSKYDTSICKIKDCPYWMPFHAVAPCSVTCGNGFIQLKRNCSTGNVNDCHGSEYNKLSCHLKDCP